MTIPILPTTLLRTGLMLDGVRVIVDGANGGAVKSRRRKAALRGWGPNGKNALSTLSTPLNKFRWSPLKEKPIKQTIQNRITRFSPGMTSTLNS
jgi:hypothetical protein